jgi:site-specific recombinase XerD
MPRLTETRVLREPKPERGERFLRCSEIKGFCARVTATGNRSWCVEVKGKRTTLGAVGVLRFEGPKEDPGARDLAIAALNAARRGANIEEAIISRRRPGSLTLNEVWKAMEEAGWPMVRGTRLKAKKTVVADCNRYDNHVRDTLGKELVENINTQSVRRWSDKSTASPSTRGKAIILVKSVLSFAESRGLSPTHPVRISVPKSRKLQNFYTQAERAALDAAAAAIVAEKPSKIFSMTIIRLLLRTGARSIEIFSLEWTMYHRATEETCATLKLDKDKTDQEDGREINLDAETAALIEALPDHGSKYMFPAESETGHTVTVQKPMDEVCDRAGVKRFRIHDLRHSYISAQLNAGASLYVAGKNAGHKRAETTQRYAHLEKSTLLDAHALTTISLTPPRKKSKAGRKPYLRVVAA